MTLVRWNPWREMDTLQRQINHLFDDSVASNEWQEMGKLSTIPAAELSQSEDAVHLRIELPGINVDDLDVQVTDNAVSISGERKSEKTVDEKGVTRSEFYYGKFQRVIPLPARIQNTQVKADYKDGILNLTLPKSEEEKTKVVKVSLNPAHS
ncbi:Hsp20 family protein [Synechococcales cyanobacterium C]|uniref:Hsp20 family protein n=1 Tax=Petrachloros mirabilis ULC683 TaxID=2781853 RepID=A0A8K2A168_9CYAN|nr:Hsp20/alpha crystallin family protein [Petrachloros mirabilis]NCJ07522.1 Hsp20 family protein [Petrachloros mirabilis ULC683]